MLYKLFSKEIQNIAKTYLEASLKTIETSSTDRVLFSKLFIIKKVEKSFQSLEESEQLIIRNEFFYGSYSKWWKSTHSKDAFIHLKIKAMSRFLGNYWREQ